MEMKRAKVYSDTTTTNLSVRVVLHRRYSDSPTVVKFKTLTHTKKTLNSDPINSCQTFKRFYYQKRKHNILQNAIFDTISHFW